MGKVIDKKNKKREMLLDTAFELFTLNGIAKTSISDIAARAGVAKGTFYLYFRDKYDLANRLVAKKANDLFAHALTRMEEKNFDTPEDRIIALTDDVLDQLAHNLLLLRFIDKNLSWGIFKIAMQSEELALGKRDMLTRIIGPDLTIWTDPMAMSYIVIEMVGSCCHSVILEKDPMPLEEFKPYLFQSIRATVSSFRRPV